MLKHTTAAILLLAAGAAQAQSPSYNYIEAVYLDFEETGSSSDPIDGDGFGINGSYSIGENFFVRASYGETRLKDAGAAIDRDGTQVTLQGGYQWAMSEVTSVYGVLGFIAASSDYQGHDEHDQDLAAGLGIRSMISDSFEVYGSFDYVDLDDIGEDGRWTAGANYNVRNWVTLGMSAGVQDDEAVYTLLARFDFGG